ncbi:acyl-CoA N-acyltransferase [Trichoderma chlorosporum]
MDNQATSQNQVIDFAPVLGTERLTLTFFDPNDDKQAEEFVAALMPIAQGVLQAKDALKNTLEALEYYRKYGRIDASLLGGRTPTKCAIWLIRLGANSPEGLCIGLISVCQRSYIPDQGWSLRPDYHGHGYATEAGKEVLRYFREELGLTNIMAPTHPRNPKSRNVAMRLGYVQRDVKVSFQDGTLLDFHSLPEASPPPEGLMIERFGRMNA